MSEENVNKIRDIYAAFGRGDIPAVLAGLHPEIEWWEAENFIYAEKIRMSVQMRCWKVSSCDWAASGTGLEFPQNSYLMQATL